MQTPTRKQSDNKQPNNPHDRFARKTVGNPVYASDFLKHYADPIIIEFVNLDRLIAAPTHYLTNELKEVILDVSFAAQLHDEEGGLDVLMFLEHKSSPCRLVPLQLGTHSLLSLYFNWTTTNYSDNYQPSFPLMLLLYHGNEDIDEELFFQDIFPKIPKKLRKYLPQFKIIVINLKRFNYDCLPGKPETQAIVESFKRATDGTFASHLSKILERIKSANLNKQQTLDITANIAQYCTWINNLTKEQIVQSIIKVFNGTEGLKMANTIQKGILQEGFELGQAHGFELGEAHGFELGEAHGLELGEERGELKCSVKIILDILRGKFGKVPRYIVNSLNQRTDAIALKSLAVHAATCSSLNDFAEEL
jgi:hypothetical protein